jgi:hypothetical protein
MLSFSLQVILLLLVVSCDSSFAFFTGISTTTTTTPRRKRASSKAGVVVLQLNPPNRQSSRRWNGNYKHASQKLADLPKSKKLRIDLTAHDGITKTLIKKREESLQHVLTKAVLWNLFLEDYGPNLQIEYDIGDPDYLPDVVSVEENNNDNDNNDNDTPKSPLFWGESGRMKVHKAVDLLQRYPETHIVHCRWGMDLESISQPLMDYLQDEMLEKGNLLELCHRPGRFTFCALPLDVWRFIDEETGSIHVTKKDLQWKELDFSSLLLVVPTNTTTIL